MGKGESHSPYFYSYAGALGLNPVAPPFTFLVEVLGSFAAWNFDLGSFFFIIGDFGSRI